MPRGPGRPRKKRAYRRRNQQDIIHNAARAADSNGADMLEARELCATVKREIVQASPEVARLALSDLITDLTMIQKMISQ